MNDELRILIDVDNVLNNLNEHVYNLCGIDLYKIKNLNDTNNENVQEVVELLKDSSIYEDLKVSDSVEELEKMSADNEIIMSMFCNNNTELMNRINWIQKHINTKNMELNVELENKKRVKNLDVAISNNKDNLKIHKARYSILVNGFNDSEEPNETDGRFIQLDSLENVISFIKEIKYDGQFANKLI